MTRTFDLQADAAARHEHQRARAEQRLLACVCPIGRWGLSLAARAGVGIDDFTQDDTHAIFAGLLVADQLGRIHDRAATISVVIASLRLAYLWDPNDNRTFAHGMHWGPHNLSRLFTCVSRWDAENLVPILARELILTTGAERRVVA